jgi:hypothetical protein
MTSTHMSSTKPQWCRKGILSFKDMNNGCHPKLVSVGFTTSGNQTNFNECLDRLHRDIDKANPKETHT